MADNVTYTELIAQVDAAITAVEIVQGVDPHTHLKPALRELQRVRRSYDHRAKRSGNSGAGISVPSGKRAAVGID